ncbi:MAG: CPP1-like family protein [Leptolyngbya sp. SIO1E4]|nr:CPP1-like family protein [Leptolyngbya sp. SIO1E4]
MTDRNSYDTLGLDESSSFEQIQEARERLLEECEGDRKRMDAIEAAYDAILMERLRLRQEGKIKVPDRIRFAEEAAEKAESQPSNNAITGPAWLADFLDTPSRNEILLPAGVFAVLVLVGLAIPSLALAVGVGCTVYFLNRKEYRFWRAILLTLLGLAVGLIVGIALGQLVAAPGAAAFSIPEQGVVQIVAAILTLIVFWAESSFLR